MLACLAKFSTAFQIKNLIILLSFVAVSYFFFLKPWPPRICLVQFDQIVPALDDAAVVFIGYPRPTTHSGETYYDGRRYDGQMNHIFLMPVYRGSVERLSIYFGRPAVDFAYR